MSEPSSKKPNFMARMFNKYLDKTQTLRYLSAKAQYGSQKFFRRENLAYQESKGLITARRKTVHVRNFFFYLIGGYFLAETCKLMHYSQKYYIGLIKASKGSWVSETLYSEDIPLPRQTLLKMNDDMMEYVKKDEQDLLTLLTLAYGLGPISQEYSYHLYEIAHLRYPDMVKGNSKLQFDIKGDTDDSEIGRKTHVLRYKNKQREISKELTEWMSAGNDSKVKFALFSTFHRVLDDLIVTTGMAKFLIMVQILQLCVMITNETNPVLTQHISSTLLRFLKFPLVYPFLVDAPIGFTYLALIPIGLIIFWIISGFMKIYRLPEKEHKKYGSLKQLYGTTLYLIDTILICPIMGTLLKLFQCDSINDNNKPTCLSTMHLSHIFIGFVLISLVLSFMILTSLFFFNYSFSQRDNLSRSSNIMHLLFRIDVLCLVIMDIFLDPANKLRTMLFLHAISSLIFLIDYYNRVPYYVSVISETYCLAISAYFWINFILLITNMAGLEILKVNVVWIILIGLTFFLYIVGACRVYFQRRMIILGVEEINEEVRLDVRFRYLIGIVKNSKKNKQDELLLTSLIKVHTEQCKNIKCVCKNRRGLYDPKKKKEANTDLPLFKDSVFVKSYLLMLIQKSTNKMPKSSLLNLDYFLFLFEEMLNLPLVNHQILLFEKQFNHNLFITVQYAIYRLRISIYYKLKEMNKAYKISSLMYENIRTYDDKMGALKNNCVETIDEFSRMWDILNHPAPDLKMLNTVCTKITDLKKVTVNIYSAILSITNASLEFLSIMKIYSIFIVFDDLFNSQIGKEIHPLPSIQVTNSLNVDVKQYKQVFSNMHEYCCSLTISLHLESLGQILYSSQSSTQIFRHDHKYIKNFNISTLMPSFIGNKHQKILMNYFQTSRTRLMQHLQNLWAIDYDKVMFSMFLALKVFISKEGLSVVGMIKRINDADYMVVNELGEVGGMGWKVRRLLGVTTDDLERGNILNLISVCPRLIPAFLRLFYKLDDFNFEGNNIDSKGKKVTIESLIKDFNKIYFFFPHDWSDQIQRISESLRAVKSKYEKNEEPRSREMMSEYCNVLYKYLDKMQTKDIDRAYKVWARVTDLRFSQGLQIWEFKIENLQKVKEDCLRPQIWKRETAFVEKINMNQARLKEIKKHEDKLLGKDNMEEINVEGLKAANKFLGKGLTKGSRGSQQSVSNPFARLLNKHKLKKKSSLASNLSGSGNDVPSNRFSKLGLGGGGGKIASNHSGNTLNSGIMGGTASDTKKPAKKFGGGLFSKLKKKSAVSTGGGKGNWFQKLKNKNINGGVIAEEKLKVELNHLSADYIQFNLDENIEDDYLEDEDENTYHKSESIHSANSNLQRKNQKKSNQSENGLGEKVNLLNKLNNDIKAGLVDTGSVNSQGGRFNHKDTIKKIKDLIASRKAPKTLVLAMQILVFVIIASIGISIYAATLKVDAMNHLKDAIVDANQINRMNILLNKISTFLEMKQLMRPPHNIPFDTAYTLPIYDFIRIDTSDSFTMMEKIYEKELTTLNLDTATHTMIPDYFFQSDIFKIRSIESDISYLNYINYCMESLYAYFTYHDQVTPVGREPRPVQTDNIIKQLNIQTEGYALIIDIKAQLVSSFKLVNTIDYSLRLILLLISVLFSLPLIYKASLRSGDVLLQLSKISSINISFYMQHYNKLSLLLKSSENNTKTLERVDNFYQTEYRLKQFKEQISGINRGARFAKWNSSDKYRWIAAGLGFVLIFAVSQIGGVIQYYMGGINLDLKVVGMVEHIEYVRKMSAYNALSLRKERETLSSGSDLVSVTALQKTTFDSIVSEHGNIFVEAKRHAYGTTYKENFEILMTKDLCEVIFDADVNLKACFNTSSVLAKHSIGGLFGFYSLNIDKIKSSQLSPGDLLTSDMMRNQLFNAYWLENSIIWWEQRQIEQYETYISGYKKTLGWIIALQSAIMIALGAVVILKVYPVLKSGVLYSLSFLLLVPFHIYKENESFSGFIKKMINFQGTGL